MTKPLRLPNVTLCAVSSVAIQPTLEALHQSNRHIEFHAIKLFSDASPESSHSDIQFIKIDKIRSRQEYSRFVLKELHNHIDSEFVLLVQWDGYVVNPSAWTDGFLEFDYIGALWPQFSDGRTVGNGGFSLRSKRLLQACRDERLLVEHAEDIAIGRTYRVLLEAEHKIRFADEAIARRFSYERTPPTGQEFGFHGVFNMVHLLGRDAFLALHADLEPNLLGPREQNDLLSIAVKSRNWRLATRILWRKCAGWTAA